MYFKVMCTLAYKEFFYSQVQLSSHTIYSVLNNEQIIVNTLFTQIIFCKIINYYDHFSTPNDVQFYIYIFVSIYFLQLFYIISFTSNNRDLVKNKDLNFI